MNSHLSEETVEEKTETASQHSAAPVRSERSLKRLVSRINSRSFAILAIAILLAVAVWFGRDLVLAGTIDGRPVGRMAVLHELESRSGRAALDTLISRRLIEREADNKNITVTQEEINDDLTKIEAQLSLQGMTLDEALAGQSMTRGDLETQIALQKKMEKILGDRIAVTDTEVDEYIKVTEIKLEKDKEAEVKEQIKEQLRAQKTSEEAGKLEMELRAAADIEYYGSYKQ